MMASSTMRDEALLWSCGGSVPVRSNLGTQLSCSHLFSDESRDRQIANEREAAAGYYGMVEMPVP